MEEQIEDIVKTEIETFSYVSKIDIDCFFAHRIKPRLAKICKDTSGDDWINCYLITDHNGQNDSSFRLGYDPDNRQFFREIILDNDISHYIGRYPDLESALDDFA